MVVIILPCQSLFPWSPLSRTAAFVVAWDVLDTHSKSAFSIVSAFHWEWCRLKLKSQKGCSSADFPSGASVTEDWASCCLVIKAEAAYCPRHCLCGHFTWEFVLLVGDYYWFTLWRPFIVSPMSSLHCSCTMDYTSIRPPLGPASKKVSQPHLGAR